MNYFTIFQEVKWNTKYIYLISKILSQKSYMKYDFHIEIEFISCYREKATKFQL